MAEILFKNEGESKPDSLIVSSKISILTKGIKLAPKQGILKRGTLVGEVNGQFYITGTSKVVGENTVIASASGILTDDVDTGNSSATLEVIATQYVSGVFNKSALFVTGNKTVAEYEATLRTLGIFLENVQ